MSEPSTIEVSAPDIESAIAKGVAELGVSRDDVIVEVLEEPARRLLGLGTKLAKVRLTVIGMRPKAPAPTVPTAPVVTAPVTVAPTPPISAPAASSTAAAPPTPATAEPPNRPAPNTAPRSQSRPKSRQAPPPRGPVRQVEHDHHDEEEDRDSGDDEDFPVFMDEEEDNHQPPASEAELANEAKIGAETLRELLRHMQIDGKVIARTAETDGHESPHWTLEIQGRDLGGLIGRRGETLSALQYITRLIASRGLEHRANLVIDVEGYKSRRETMLKRLAKRMADQAVQRGRTVQLEPMPPHERRIIHLTLRDHPGVRTESIGDGDHRKVTIVPKKAK